MASFEMNEELLGALHGCKNVEDVIALAKKNGLDVTEEKARKVLAIMQKEKLSDEELDKVAGGESCADKADERCGK